MHAALGFLSKRLPDQRHSKGDSKTGTVELSINAFLLQAVASFADHALPYSVRYIA